MESCKFSSLTSLFDVPVDAFYGENFRDVRTKQRMAFHIFKLYQYYTYGFCRGKINELNVEIAKLTKEINQFNQENASYLSYEKRQV